MTQGQQSLAAHGGTQVSRLHPSVGVPQPACLVFRAATKRINSVERLGRNRSGADVRRRVLLVHRGRKRAALFELRVNLRTLQEQRNRKAAVRIRIFYFAFLLFTFGYKLRSLPRPARQPERSGGPWRPNPACSS